MRGRQSRTITARRMRMMTGRPGHPSTTLGRRFSPLRALLLTAVVVLAACDSGPEGPGTVTVFVTAPSLGGAVLEVRGSGIEGFEARGSARVYSAALQGRPGMHRLVVISPEPGELVFDVSVADLGMEGPAVSVVSAADGENRSMRSSEVRVRVGG